MRDSMFIIFGGNRVENKNKVPKIPKLITMALFVICIMTTNAFAQGSVFGIVANSDLSTPVNGEVSFVGYLDNTDEEIRIETSDGAGYDAGNWFDDFQNYLTEAPGNPYDYHFYNTANGEGFQLSNVIPNNSFQQENVLLASVAWPTAPTALSGITLSGSSVLLTWNASGGSTYHIYRRPAVSNGSFFRIDDLSGSLSNPGVADSFYVDNTVDGINSYDFVIIAEDGSGNLSPHSTVITINSSVTDIPVLASIIPNSGVVQGGLTISLDGSGFDPAGVDVQFGAQIVSATVVSPYLLTMVTPIGTGGAIDVSVINTASGFNSNTLIGVFTYIPNSDPVLAIIGAQQSTEGLNLQFITSASDADGDIPTLTSSALPGTATYVDNGDGTGTFNWSPTFLDAGVYNVTFYATDIVVPSLIDSEQVQITILEAGNQTPVLASIGAKNGTENVLLTFAISATDPEATIPTLTTSALPTGATFVDNGDGSGAFNWTPGFTQAGIYNITFTASDGVATVDEIVTITIADAGNQNPVLAAIGAQAGTENILMNFIISASDVDGTIPALTTSVLPTGATFVDNGDGSGTFNWIPDFTQAGSFDITFTASDGVATDDEIVTITISEAGNQAPVLTAIGPQSVTENVLLSFSVTASDVDGTIPTFTTSLLPTGAVFVDNGDGTGSFDWTPDFTQAGTYDVTITTSDGTLTDDEIVTITILEAGNQSPVLASIGAQSVIENNNLNFVISASDADGTIPTFTAIVLPTGASFVDNGDGTGTFDWTPGFIQSGSYDVTFTATDGIAQVNELVTITVTEAGNQNPVLASIGAQSVTENVQLTFGITATDAEGIPSLTTSVLPTGASFIDNGDGTGTFDWTPDFTQSGSYDVTFTADDGLAQATEIVTITVNEIGNQIPVLAAIGAQILTENVLHSFVITATDADGTIPILTTSALPTGAIFVDNGDGTGTFDWTPDFLQAGSYDITFTAGDGIDQAIELVTLTVNEAGNQIPVLTAIGAQITTENIQLTFGVSATDAEGIPSLTSSVLPAGASFIDNGDGTGAFDWTPDFLQAGSYNITFTASDGIDQASEIVTITVNEAGNQLPVLTSIGAQFISEGSQLTFAVSGSDIESIPVLTTSLLPAGAFFVDNGDGTGTFDWTPDFTQAGTFNITFTATDDSLAIASELVTISVSESGNQSPVLTAIGAQLITEGNLLSFVAVASDADGDPLTMTSSVLPGGATYIDNGDGTGSFDWTPDFIQSGTYDVTFTASDGFISVNETVTITVNDAGNQIPVLALIGAQTIDENLNLNFGVSATDADNTIPTLTTSLLPTGASFIDNGDGTGSFDWTPDFVQAGIYNITFTASDGVDQSIEVVTITINEIGNQLPILDPIASIIDVEGSNINFLVTSSDAEGIPTLTTSALPVNATFVDNFDGTGVFDWTPDFTQSGSYDITFYATDDSAIQVSQIMNITVNEAGAQAPVIAVVSDTSVIENDILSIDVTASDPDGGAVVLTVNTTLSNFTFVDNGDGTGVLTYSPDFNDAGVDSIIFLATDNDVPQQSGSAVSVITTLENNQVPVFEAIGPYFVDVNKTLTFDVVAYDSTDGDPAHILLLSAIGVPANATFVDNGDGTGTFEFSPLPGQDGIYSITFLVTDMGSPQLTATMPVDVTALPVNNPPVLDPIGPQTILEGEILTVNISATDLDGTIPYFSVDTSNLTNNSTFVDNGDGTAQFTFTASFVQSGLVYVTFFAHDGIDFDKEVVLVQVYEAGEQPPKFGPIPNPSILEGITSEIVITAFDPDELPVVINAFDSTMPANFVFFDSGNGVAVITATPDFLQAGTYIIGLEVSDGVLADTTDIIIIVDDAGNQTPVIAPVSDYSTGETVALNFTVTGADLDGVPNLTMSGTGLPIQATFTDNGDGTGTFNWTPGYFDSGTYIDIVFYAIDDTDPALYDSSVIIITVNDLNQKPWGDFPAQLPDSLFEGDTLWYTIIAWDNDLTIPTVTAYLDGEDTLASNMTIDSTYIDVVNNWRVSVLRFAPDYTQGNDPSGTIYYFKFKICDELDAALCRETSQANIKVYNRNQIPQLIFTPDNTGPFTISEGVNLNFLITATDDAGLPDSLVARNLPPNATFAGTQFQKSFNFTPGFSQAGQYQVTFVAYDNTGDSNSVTVDIDVTEAGNQTPIFTTILPEFIPDVYIGSPIQTTVITTDPDLDSVTLAAVYTGANMGFTWSGSMGTATGSFTFTPNPTQSNGYFEVQFIATDYPGGFADTMKTTYHVLPFMRGDLDSDNLYTMNDIVYLINYIFKGGPAPIPYGAGDADNSGEVNVTDISFMVNYLFLNGDSPPQ